MFNDTTDELLAHVSPAVRCVLLSQSNSHLSDFNQDRVCCQLLLQKFLANFLRNRPVPKIYEAKNHAANPNTTCTAYVQRTMQLIHAP